MAHRAKYLALKKPTKRDVLDKSYADVTAIRHEADEARCALVESSFQ